MMIALPGLDGTLQPYQLGPPPAWQPAQAPPQSRIAYAAAHVVADPLTDPAAPAAALDWDATLRLRRHLWAHGLRVADGMDSAQRNMGLDWPAASQPGWTAWGKTSFRSVAKEGRRPRGLKPGGIPGSQAACVSLCWPMFTGTCPRSTLCCTTSTGRAPT